ncbi:MAG: hypothetical protein QOH69_2875 [Actinomycetota bacterium]|jgi:hypothetical protein|nr:hypothetical protein [Actinomycetota bacterium]
MSGLSIALRCAVGALAIATLAALAGCSPTSSAPPSAAPTKTTAAGKPTPTPTPTPTFAALKYTCSTILPPATLAVFKSKKSDGFTLQSDYLERMQNIGSNLVSFSTYGGILCQWSYPDSSSNVDYAFSAITDEQVKTQQQTLTSTGYVGAEKDHGMLFANTDTADYPDEYLFIDGYWFQASSDAVMQLLVDNVFVIPN